MRKPRVFGAVSNRRGAESTANRQRRENQENLIVILDSQRAKKQHRQAKGAERAQHQKMPNRRTAPYRRMPALSDKQHYLLRQWAGEAKDLGEHGGTLFLDMHEAKLIDMQGNVDGVSNVSYSKGKDIWMEYLEKATTPNEQEGISMADKNESVIDSTYRKTNFHGDVLRRMQERKLIEQDEDQKFGEELITKRSEDE